jgi:hypothetical protein
VRYDAPDVTVNRENAKRLWIIEDGFINFYVDNNFEQEEHFARELQ